MGSLKVIQHALYSVPYQTTLFHSDRNLLLLVCFALSLHHHHHHAGGENSIIISIASSKNKVLALTIMVHSVSCFCLDPEFCTIEPPHPMADVIMEQNKRLFLCSSYTQLDYLSCETYVNYIYRVSHCQLKVVSHI